MKLHEQARTLKALMVARRGNPKATLKDLETLIKCYTMGEYEPVWRTRLYQKYGPEYCEYLSILSETAGEPWRKLPLSEIAPLTLTELRAYFTPGRLVPAEACWVDKVIDFVTVQDGQRWLVCVCGTEQGAHPRTHCTMPTWGDLKESRKLNHREG